MSERLCDWCEAASTEHIEITVERKDWQGRKRREGIGRFVDACAAHKDIAQRHADSFVPASQGSLADELKLDA